jgi:hypothetical protein
MHLPLDSAQLARDLSQPLGPRPEGLRLDVPEAEFSGGCQAPSLLRVRIKVIRPSAPPEMWQVEFPLERSDHHMAYQSFVTTIRANIEEWWDVKDQEPQVAAWGRRLG